MQINQIERVFVFGLFFFEMYVCVGIVVCRRRVPFDEKCPPAMKYMMKLWTSAHCTLTHNTDSRHMSRNTVKFDWSCPRRNSLLSKKWEPLTWTTRSLRRSDGCRDYARRTKWIITWFNTPWYAPQTPPQTQTTPIFPKCTPLMLKWTPGSILAPKKNPKMVHLTHFSFFERPANGRKHCLKMRGVRFEKTSHFCNVHFVFMREAHSWKRTLFKTTCMFGQSTACFQCFSYFYVMFPDLNKSDVRW